MLLFHLRLDGGTHAHHGHAAVKTLDRTERESEQRRGREAFPRLKTRRQPIAIGRAGWPLKTLTKLLLRAMPLKEGITVVDAVSKPARTPLRGPIRARAPERLLLSARAEETASRMCA